MKREALLMLCAIVLSLTSLNVNAEILCNDTDGGKNYNTFGKVCLGGSCVLDTCMVDGLNERYCEGNESYTEQYTCPVACENGKCINSSEENKIIECNDSDGKENYLNPGYILLKYQDNSTEKIKDICKFMTLEKAYAVKDYFCENISEGYNYSFSLKICEAGCENSICLEDINKTEKIDLIKEINKTEEVNNTNETEIFKELKKEKELGENCDKDYECRSNLCTDGKCDNPSFFQRLLEFLDRLFGDKRNQ